MRLLTLDITVLLLLYIINIDWLFVVNVFLYKNTELKAKTLAELDAKAVNCGLRKRQPSCL